MQINNENLNISLAKECMTLSDLRQLANISGVTLYKIKNNDMYKPSTKTIGKIAKVLNVPVEYLIKL